MPKGATAIAAVGQDRSQHLVRATDIGRTTRRMHLQHLAQQLVDSGDVLGTRSPDLN